MSVLSHSIYCGPAPLSEQETSAVAKFLRANRAIIKGYITLHSYGNYIIHPWGYDTKRYPADVEELVIDLVNLKKMSLFVFKFENN